MSCIGGMHGPVGVHGYVVVKVLHRGGLEFACSTLRAIVRLIVQIRLGTSVADK